jgi:hypothetical protein
MEDINIDDVEFAEDPNSIFVDSVSEYNLSYSTVGGPCWLVGKLDEL